MSFKPGDRVKLKSNEMGWGIGTVIKEIPNAYKLTVGQDPTRKGWVVAFDNRRETTSVWGQEIVRVSPEALLLGVLTHLLEELEDKF